MNTFHKIASKIAIIIGMIVLQLPCSCKKSEVDSHNSKELKCIVSGLLFAEGPAYNNGTLYFSDIEASTIYKWTEQQGVSTFNTNSARANGLYFSPQGILYACQGGNKRIVTIDDLQNVNVLTSSYNGKPYNEPNDLWISPSGNVYFTDPNFTSTLTQDGQYVFCILAATGEVFRVIDDLVKPNGIVGNHEGTLLYVADWGASKIYRYNITSNGSLSSKVLFANVQADGLTIDDEGNVYAASDQVFKFNSLGELVDNLSVSGTITNLFYVNSSPDKLFITTHTDVYLQEL
jgi:gluconolactonase